MPSAGSDDITLRDKRMHYRGRASVFLDSLQYRGTSAHQKVDEKHITQLLNVFKAEGCLRLHNPDHYVPVIVSSDDFKKILAQNGIRNLALMQDGEPKFLHIPTDARVTVLHGEHRLRAAERYLEPADRWWVVVLYITGLSESSIKSIREEYSHQLKFSDGEIYRNIRIYEAQGDSVNKEKWRVRLSEKKRYYVSQLDKDENRPIRDAFDQLLPFIGLWDDLELGWLSRILPLHCSPPTKEFANYLEHIYATFTNILQDPELFALLDVDTVKLLETATPEALEDALFIDKVMSQGQLFPAIDDPFTREQINVRIKKIQGRIPSFFTFFKDSIYMEALVKSLRPLIPAPSGSTLRDAFFHRFTSRHRSMIQVQTDHQDFRLYKGTTEHCKLLAYLMLFLAAMRDFPSLSQIAPRKPRGQGKLRIDGSRELSQSRLARLASDLGFSSKEIDALIAADPDVAAAKAFLRDHWPPSQYDRDEQGMLMLARHIAEHGRHFATLRTEHHLAPEFSSQLNGIPKKLRCGLPDSRSYIVDRDYLFLPVIYNYKPVPRAHLTSLAIQRDIFVCFFGAVPLQGPLRGRPSPSSGGYDDDSDDNHTDISPTARSDIQSNGRHDDDTYDGVDPGNQNVRQALASNRSGSSDYDTRSDTEYYSGRIPDFERYLEDIEAALGPPPSPTDTIDPTRMQSGIFEGSLLAPGFERSTALRMNTFHSLDGDIKASVAVREYLSEVHNLITIFLWGQKKYIKFFQGDQGMFEDTVNSLADEGFCFAVIKNNRITLYDLPDLWSAAQEARLVFASTRTRMAHYIGEDSELAFLEYIDDDLSRESMQF